MTSGVIGALLLLLPQASSARGAVSSVMNAAVRGDCATVERISLESCESFGVPVSWGFYDQYAVETVRFDVGEYKKNSGLIEAYRSLEDNIPSLDELYKLRQKHDRSGLCVVALPAGSNAEKAGLEVGDVITEYNGQAVNRFSEIVSARNAAPASGKIKVKIVRGDAPMDIWVDPGKLGCHAIELMTDVSHQRYEIAIHFKSKRSAVEDELFPQGLVTFDYDEDHYLLQKSLGYASFDDLPDNSTLVQYKQDITVKVVLKSIIQGINLNDKADVRTFKYDLITPGGRRTGSWFVSLFNYHTFD